MQVYWLVIGCCIFSSFSHAESSRLNIYMWEDSLSAQVIHDWESSGNDKLHITNFDNDDERNRLMMNSPLLPFDLVVLDNTSAQLYGNLGAFEDLSTLANIRDNDPIWNQACGRYAVPYFWGSVGIAYRKDKIANPPTNWTQFLTPTPELKGHVGMITDSVETLLPALYSLGLSPTTDRRDELKKAYAIMQDFLPSVLSFEYILSYVRSHPNDDNIWIAMAYSGDNYSLNRYTNDDNWAFIIPDDQLYIWVDCVAVNKNSQHKLQAKALVEYLSQPQVAAKNAQYLVAATPNLSALNLMPDWYRHDSTLFAEHIRIHQGQLDASLSADNLSLRAKIIHQLLKDHETQH